MHKEGGKMSNINSIIFNKKSSEDFGLLIGYIDDPDKNSEFSRETIKGDPNSNDKFNYYGCKSTSGIHIDFVLYKEDGTGFSDMENAEINEWLLESRIPTTLHMNSENALYLDYHGIVTNIQDKIFGGKFAKAVTFETDAPYAYEKLDTKKQSITSTGSITIKNKGCDNCYPTITIIPNGSKSIVIKNNTDNCKSITLDVTNYQSGIIIDGDRCRITDINGKLIPLSNLGFTATSSILLYWIKLLRGINHLEITGSCNIQFRCEFHRKVGTV